MVQLPTLYTHAAGAHLSYRKPELLAVCADSPPEASALPFISLRRIETTAEMSPEGFKTVSYTQHTHKKKNPSFSVVRT